MSAPGQKRKTPVEYMMSAYDRIADQRVEALSRRTIQPSYCHRIDVVRSCDVGLRLASLKTLKGFAPLVRVELRRPSELDAASLSPLTTPVRALVSSRSNSANPPKTVSMSRPCGVVVSAQVSPIDRKPAPLSAIVARMLSRSRVERARRSRRATMTTSPVSSEARSRASPLRSERAPDTSP